MYPYLIQTPDFTVGTYGVMLAVAYLTGRYCFLKHLTQKNDNNKNNYEFLVLSLLFFGVLGAKLMFILKNPEQATLNWHSIIAGSGFSSQGAVLAAIFVLLIYSKLHKIKLSDLLDSAAPAAALSYTLARIGCFLAGDDCYGVASNLPWAMSFPHGVKPTQEQVHPLPIYEAIYSFAIWLLLEKLAKQKHSPYELFYTLLLLWGSARFLIEFISTNPKLLAGMSGSQTGALMMMTIGMVYFTQKNFFSDKKKPG